MAEEQADQVARRWAGYVCPMCRMIFRIEAGHAGRRAQCPGCQAVLMLGGGAGSPNPAAAEVPPASAEAEPVADREEAPGEAPEEPESEDGPAAGARRIKKRKLVTGEPQWERKKRRTKRTSMTGPVLAGLVLLGVVAIGVYWARGVMGRDGQPGPENRGKVTDGPGAVTGAEDLAAVADMDATLDEIRDAVRRFLEADSVDALLETVRDRERLEPAIRRFHAEGYAPTGYRTVAGDGKLQTLGTLYSVDVELEDLPRRPVAVERTGKGYLIDWESWVGHSDLPWEEFMRRRPTEPMTFRVKCEDIDYYNFAFSDDQQWQSYRLESPGGEHTLYGYVPRDSLLNRELKPLDPDARKTALTLRLRYPEGGGRADQVLVDRVVTNGWVVGGGQTGE